jgi:CDP-glucose 4,6-dehydratase
VLAQSPSGLQRVKAALSAVGAERVSLLAPDQFPRFLLELVRTSPSVRSVIYVTSDKCYRNKEWIWGYRENDELGGHDPYSASKAAAEVVFASYQSSFFNQRSDIGLASVRAGNVIGGGDWSEDRIIPDCIKALGAKKPIVLRNPQATRPWQHVLEPVFGYLEIAAKLTADPTRYRGSYNFGPDMSSCQPVEALARKAVEVWGSGSVTIDAGKGPHEAGFLHLNIDKVKSVLGWRPRWDFDASVRHTVDWYRQVAGGAPADTVTRQHIARYQESFGESRA